MDQPEEKRTYFCPYCDQKLSFLEGTLMKLVGRLHCEGFSCKTMFYIPAQLGQWGAIVGEGVRVNEGAHVEFECINGACKANFTTATDDNLAEVRMRDGRGREYVVVFNKVFGRRSTFLMDVSRMELLKSYGEHASEYMAEFKKPRNYFGA